jgi:hypothetical protein
LNSSTATSRILKSKQEFNEVLIVGVDVLQMEACSVNEPRVQRRRGAIDECGKFEAVFAVFVGLYLRHWKKYYSLT